MVGNRAHRLHRFLKRFVFHMGETGSETSNAKMFVVCVSRQ